MVRFAKKKVRLKNGLYVILRPVEERDIQQVWQNFNEVVFEGKYLPVFTPVIDDWEKRSWFKDMQRGSNFCIIAEWEDAPKGENVVGQCTVEDIQWEASAHVGQLGIIVKKEFRNLGVGYALIEYAKEVARRYGKKKIILSTFNTNESGYHLYRKCGFTECGRYRAQFYMNDTYIDEILMECFMEPCK